MTTPAWTSDPQTKRARGRLRWNERLVLGVMLALAFFAFEAGLATIALGRDAACRSWLASARVAPAAGSGCMSEFTRAAATALARGPAGALLQETMTVASWALSIVLYAVLGGACAQLSPGRGVLAFLGVHAALAAIVTFIQFIGPHLVQ
jgi:hypothetical protein